MMKSLSLVLCIGLGALAHSGCGFQPVHAPSASAQSGPILVNEIDGRSGHELRKALLAETANGLPGAPQGGVMEVSLKERVINTTFRPDGSTSRARLRLTADYVIDLGDDARSGTERAEATVNIPDNIFQDINNQTEAREIVAQLLARQIIDRLIIELTSSP